MSDAFIFMVGSGVFAVTTTATLLLGYSWFNERAVEEGVADGSDQADGSDGGGDPISDPKQLFAIPADIDRVTPRPVLAATR